LEKETDARGRKLIVHKVPVPGKPVCITEYELAGFSFEEGEEQRKAGERLAASYVNFYITNGGVLIPQFGDEMDAEAVNIIGGLFPGRKVYPVYARDIIVGDYSFDKAIKVGDSLPLKSSYPNLLITLHSLSAPITAISGSGIPLNVLFLTME
jgi:agmatine/peptidylarginine deiminase